MTTRITRPVGEAIASRDRVSPCLLLVAFCASALLLSACGDDGAGTEAADADEASTQDESPNDGNGDEAGGVEEDDAEEAEESASATGPTVPPNMPQGIPVPDEHVVLRADSLTGSDADVDLGEHVAANIAIGGTVEDQRAFYETELRAAYGDVEVEDGMAGEALRFQGEWFENGRVFVTENDGGLDGGGLETSHLPVMLTVQVWSAQTSDRGTARPRASTVTRHEPEVHPRRTIRPVRSLPGSPNGSMKHNIGANPNPPLNVAPACYLPSESRCSSVASTSSTTSSRSACSISPRHAA